MDSVSPKITLRKCKFCQQEKLHSTQGFYTAPACMTCMRALPPIPEGQKRCNACLKPKDLEEFLVVSGLGRRHPWCHPCRKAIRKQRYQNPEKAREAHLRSAYNLTSEEYDVMLFRQGGVCAICGKPETVIDPYTKRAKSLGVDHNHRTNQVRELLCHSCNQLVGWMEKDREQAKNVLKYLKKHDT